MSEKPFGLLELGSNSLKFYIVEVAKEGGHKIKTHKFPWRVAHDFFSTGKLGEPVVQEMIAAIRGVEKVSDGVQLSTMLAVATGVFRELTEIGTLAVRVKTETGIRLRVITGEDEARLMAKGFTGRDHKGSALLCDLGGATTEWAWIVDGVAKHWGSLPLGAIRFEYKLGRLKKDPKAYLEKSTEQCDAALASLDISQNTSVLATGGTAKAAAFVLDKDVIPHSELKALIDQILRDGPPASLKPERQTVFLPGLVILERICSHCGSPTLEYAKTSVRDGMAGRLIQLLGAYRRQDLHSTLLLHTKGV